MQRARLTLVLLCAAVAVACSTVDPKLADAADVSEPCLEPQTGSRIKRCVRDQVKVITRDELERSGPFMGPPIHPGTMPQGL
jgi:hypothetical protein